MKENIKKDIKRYSSLTAAYALANFQANAGEIITSVNYTGGYESYSIDIDGDGTNDFGVHCLDWGGALGYTGNSFTLELFGNNEMIIDASLTSGNPYPQLLSQSYLLSSGNNFGYDSNVWVGGSNYIARGMYGGGYKKNPAGTVYDWGSVGGESGFYLGVKFEIGANTHYGWMRFNVATKVDSWKLIDMGYEDVADTPLKINADPTVAINPNQIEDVNVTMQDGYLQINSGETNLDKIELLSMSGQTLAVTEEADKSLFIGDLGKGIYIIRMTTSNQAILSKKISVTAF